MYSFLAEEVNFTFHFCAFYEQKQYINAVFFMNTDAAPYVFFPLLTQTRLIIARFPYLLPKRAYIISFIAYFLRKDNFVIHNVHFH